MVVATFMAATTLVATATFVMLGFMMFAAATLVMVLRCDPVMVMLIDPILAILHPPISLVPIAMLVVIAAIVNSIRAPIYRSVGGSAVVAGTAIAGATISGTGAEASLHR